MQKKAIIRLYLILLNHMLHLDYKKFPGSLLRKDSEKRYQKYVLSRHLEDGRTWNQDTSSH